jgi:hypothetical protein
MADKMKLIVEAREFDKKAVESLVEAVEGGGQNYFIKGVFIQTEAKNRNGRNYPKPLMEACVAKYMQERMNPAAMRSFGELGHPDGVEINLDKVSHYVTELVWSGNDVVGKAEILTDNPSGRIVETFLKKKLTIGVSTRGLGSLGKVPKADGSKPVTSYEMIAIDIVADPSAPKGFVDGILENKEYIIKDSGCILECYEGLEREISSLPRHYEAKEKLLLEALEKFMTEIKKK